MTIEKLRMLGADVDDGLTRCMNDESFYLMLLPEALKRDQYEDLEKKILEGDMNAAFERAHAMKGVLSNMALTPLAGKVSEITELLRAGTQMDYGPLLDEMWQIYESFTKE